MTDETPPGTRALILRAALELFAAQGFHATSVREIAERVGVTKAAVLYHFPGKADILAELAEPMLRDLESAVSVAEAAPPAQARRLTLEGLLDALIAHRHLLRSNLHDPASATAAMMDRYSAVLFRANALVAGPGATFPDQVLAAQAISMLTDPVVLFADSPVHRLRAAILHNLNRLIPPTPTPPEGEDSTPAASPPATPTRRRRPGRPVTMTPEMIATARRRSAAGATAATIAAELGVSRATIYRHLSP